MNPAKGTFKFIYIDANRLRKTPTSFDTLEKISTTKTSPLRKVVIGYEESSLS